MVVRGVLAGVMVLEVLLPASTVGSIDPDEQKIFVDRQGLWPDTDKRRPTSARRRKRLSALFWRSVMSHQFVAN
ncbi:hypothetical protein [Streptomyces sp. NPDC005262]|uniref:hypothetical protein n=1 Tax=Streptomyces sp. NPDC005262 TaxID=3364710 RepID=UPI003698BE1D